MIESERVRQWFTALQVGTLLPLPVDDMHAVLSKVDRLEAELEATKARLASVEQVTKDAVCVVAVFARDDRHAPENRQEAARIEQEFLRVFAKSPMAPSEGSSLKQVDLERGLLRDTLLKAIKALTVPHPDPEIDAWQSSVVRQADDVVKATHDSCYAGGALPASTWALLEALRGAVEVAWDGPSKTVGTGCAETYHQWRSRLEKQARDVLSVFARFTR